MGRRPKVVLKTVGMNELIRTIEDLGELPQKCVTKAARSGARVGLTRLKAETHFKNTTGFLKKNLTVKGEKSKKKGKKTYRIMFKEGVNEFSSPEIIDKGKYGGEGTFYYPISVEFGRLGAHGKSQGMHYMVDSADKNSEDIKQEMLNVLKKEIDKIPRR